MRPCPDWSRGRGGEGGGGGRKHFPITKKALWIRTDNHQTQLLTYTTELAQKSNSRNNSDGTWLSFHNISCSLTV